MKRAEHFLLPAELDRPLTDARSATAAEKWRKVDLASETDPNCQAADAVTARNMRATQLLLLHTMSGQGSPRS